jgi:hypothetical protein
VRCLSHPRSVEAATEPGPNEQAVLAQTQDSALADARPATVQQALTLARLLDNQEFSAMHPTASRQLHLLLTSLELAKRKMANRRLATVIAMTARKGVGQ